MAFNTSKVVDPVQEKKTAGGSDSPKFGAGEPSVRARKADSSPGNPSMTPHQEKIDEDMVKVDKIDHVLVNQINDCADGKAAVSSNMLTPYYEQFNVVKKLIMSAYVTEISETSKQANVNAQKRQRK